MIDDVQAALDKLLKKPTNCDRLLRLFGVLGCIVVACFALWASQRGLHCLIPYILPRLQFEGI